MPPAADPNAAIDAAARAFRAGSYPEAERLSHEAHRLAPRHPQPLIFLTFTALFRNEFDAAESFARKAHQANRKEPICLCLLGQTFLARGRFHEAVRWYEKARKINPDHPEAVAGLADTYDRLGRSDEARSLLEPALGAPDVSDASRAVWVRILEAGREFEAVTRFVTPALLERMTDPTQKRYCLLALARVLEKLDRHEEAIGAAHEANAIRRPPFDPRAFTERFDRLARAYRNIDASRITTSGNQDERFVFVVGLPRSGSTLIEQIIHAHAEAAAIGEVSVMAERFADVEKLHPDGAGFPEGVPDLTPDQLMSIAKRYRDGVRKLLPNPPRRVADKTLENIERIGFIHALFPRARFIICERHPLDIGVSCYLQDLPPTVHPWSTDLASIGAMINYYEGLRDFWIDRFPEAILEVQYEHLIADPEAHTRRVIDFIGLEWDPACLEFHKADRTVHTISYTQVKQPIYQASRGRFSAFGDGLKPLIDTLGDRLARAEQRIAEPPSISGSCE